MVAFRSFRRGHSAVRKVIEAASTSRSCKVQTPTSTTRRMFSLLRCQISGIEQHKRPTAVMNQPDDKAATRLRRDIPVLKGRDILLPSVNTYSYY